MSSMKSPLPMVGAPPPAPSAPFGVTVREGAPPPPPPLLLAPPAVSARFAARPQRRLAVRIGVGSGAAAVASAAAGSAAAVAARLAWAEGAAALGVCRMRAAGPSEEGFLCSAGPAAAPPLLLVLLSLQAHSGEVTVLPVSPGILPGSTISIYKRLEVLAWRVDAV